MNRLLSLMSVICSLQLSAQTINGLFSSLANQQVKLTGFEGFSIYTIG